MKMEFFTHQLQIHHFRGENHEEMIHLDKTIHAFIPMDMDFENTVSNAKNTESILVGELQDLSLIVQFLLNH